MTPKRFKPLEKIYSQMDKTWDIVAAGYNFHCNGCSDNCCKSLFFHHTHIEKNYFLHGFNTLDPEKKSDIIEKANVYVKNTFSHTRVMESQKIMCPVNEKGLCLLYLYRPMICRMHGLPHEVCRPGFHPVKGPGCTAGNFDNLTYTPFDRTPFYQQMVQIEMTFRSHINKTGKIKETIAQMILTQ